MRRLLAVLFAAVALLPGHAHAGLTAAQQCYFSGGPNQQPQHTYYPGTVAPWTGVTAPAATIQPWYGASGCAGDGWRVGFMSHACNDPDCASISPIRTAQLIYPLPQIPAYRTWTVNTNVTITGRSTPWQVAQTVYFWLALNDTARHKHVWFEVILWDSRGSQIFNFPGVISDRLAGGGTDSLNVLGFLAGGYSRYAHQTGGQMSNNAAGGVFSFQITTGDMLAALADVARVDPSFSANPADYTVTAAAVDFESFRFGGAPDWCAFVVNSMSLT